MVYLSFGEQLGDFLVGPHIGEGRGGTVFSASRKGFSQEVQTNALKYPANEREISTLLALHGTEPPCLGVPKVQDSGMHDGRPFMVMDLLGPSLFELMGHSIVNNWRFPCPVRWQNIRLLGRLLLRRLRDIHQRGFVHCDIQPDNILIGRKSGQGIERCTPFFIDFGLAHPSQGGEPIDGHAGTIEYNSIRSFDGGVRLPRDDVESLGWVMCYFVVGDLPWFGEIKKVNWGDKQLRTELCRWVQQEKRNFITSSGPDSLLKMQPGVPAEIAEYLRLCQRFGGDKDIGKAAQPDYDALARILGSATGVGGIKEEQRDLELLKNLLTGGNADMLQRRVDPESVNRYFIVSSWNSWAFEEMSPIHGKPGTYLFEFRLLRDGGEFQVVRNRDWKQSFYPRHKRACGRTANPVMGPAGKSHGYNWALEKVAGDVVAIIFHEPTASSDGQAHMSWQRLRHEPPCRTQKPSAKYFLVGSWDAWSSTQEMVWREGSCRVDVIIGEKGCESFQILENGDWSRILHPNIKDANMNKYTPHVMLGPERGSGGKNWTIGQHPKDRAAPGASIEIRLVIGDGVPQRVEWSPTAVVRPRAASSKSSTDGSLWGRHGDSK